MTTKEFQSFKNELTVDSANVQQSQKFVLDPLDGTRFLIYCDGTLFCNLLNSDPKLLKQFKKRRHQWQKNGLLEVSMTLYEIRTDCIQLWSVGSTISFTKENNEL